MIYFTSDLHFGHVNVIDYCDRPFKSVLEMDAELIKRWNETVRQQDDIYILGDISFYHDKERNARLINTLNGKKHLIKGNHDYSNVIPTECFVEIVDYKELKYNKQFFVLSHYPILSWNKRHHGSIHLFGHVHEISLGDYEKQRAYNVGVDKNNFSPISINDIMVKMEGRKIC